MPAAGDLNQDNKLDLIICAEVDSFGNQQILFYQNTWNISESPISGFKGREYGFGGVCPRQFVYTGVDRP